LKAKSASKHQSKLRTKMAAALNDQTKELSAEFKQILIEDMVAAFENRINVLNRSVVKNHFKC